MTIVGIDYSKNSPAACVIQEDSLRLISFYRASNEIFNKKGKISEHFSTLRRCGLEFYLHELHAPPKLSYSESEEFKIYDASLLAKLVVDSLPSEADAVCLEGFSYGARGNAVLDVAGYAYCARQELLKKYGRNKLKIFAPSEVKRTAGKGNAGKPQMLEYFLACEDERLTSTETWKTMKEGKVDCVLKPLDDIVDAFWVAKTFFRLFPSLPQ